MSTWERYGLCILALGIPAAVVVFLFARAAGQEVDRAARDCERALRLGLPLPEDCDPPVEPRGASAAPREETAAPADEFRTYERRGGMRGRGPAPTTLALRTPEPRPGTTYVVREGDTFLGIVRRAYGSTERWPDVWFENLHLVRGGEFLPVGTELRLPR
jgi:nucleoid-associated protein YgaU